MDFQKLINLAKNEQIEDIEIYYSEGKTLKIDLFNAYNAYKNPVKEKQGFLQKLFKKRGK